jgi:hypothetical protein
MAFNTPFRCIRTSTVLDEADQMADMGFMPQITHLLDQVRPDGQRMLFSERGGTDWRSSQGDGEHGNCQGTTREHGRPSRGEVSDRCHCEPAARRGPRRSMPR